MFYKVYISLDCFVEIGLKVIKTKQDIIRQVSCVIATVYNSQWLTWHWTGDSRSGKYLISNVALLWLVLPLFRSVCR